MTTHITNSIPGKTLRALMDAHKLTGNEGADIVAGLLGYSRSSVQGMLSRGMRRNDYLLLKCTLECAPRRVLKMLKIEPQKGRATRSKGG